MASTNPNHDPAQRQLSSNEEPAIVVSGAGLAGSLLAVFLRRKGYRVKVYERRVDMRTQPISAGRSINLAMSERALNALRAVGLEASILEIAIPMRGRMMHPINGDQVYQSYSADGTHAIYSVSRGELNCKLMSLAEAEGAELFFEHKCIGMDFRSGVLKFGIGMDSLRSRNESMEGVPVVSVKSTTTFGADGAFSGVRREMFRLPRFNYSQQFLEHGYKELSIPAGPGGSFLLEKNPLHIWPRGSYMMIALPNLDGSFTCTLFFPHEGEFSFATLNTEEKVMSFFKTQFPDAVPLMPTLVQDFFNNPTSALCTVRCFPWSVEDKLAILGDAAHAIVPFFGQGMNCAFEDCFVLSNIVDEYRARAGKEEDGFWKAVFQEFQSVRKPNAEAIADMALENFIEMRDKVGDRRFLFRKRLEYELEKRFPSQFKSRYEMISFSNVPYSHAQRLGLLNDKVLDALLAPFDANTPSAEEQKNLETLVDWEKARVLVDHFLPSSLVQELVRAPYSPATPQSL